jgi:hypothetical protein
MNKLTFTWILVGTLIISGIIFWFISTGPVHYLSLIFVVVALLIMPIVINLNKNEKRIGRKYTSFIFFLLAVMLILYIIFWFGGLGFS